VRGFARQRKVVSIFEEVRRLNVGGRTFSATGQPVDVAAQCRSADAIVLVVDNALDGGGEGHDRYTIGARTASLHL
jgi:hypothetical protein